MANRLAKVRAVFARSRVHSESVVVAVFAALVFLLLGGAARRKAIPVGAEQTRLANAAAALQTFRSVFTVSTPNDDVGISLPETYAVSIDRDQRVTAAQRLTALGELDGLANVQVSFASTDSAAPPARPELVDGSVTLADYAIAVDCDGGFASVLSLVNQLPASVALQRIVATRGRSATHFHIILAVFEPTGTNQHG